MFALNRMRNGAGFSNFIHWIIFVLHLSNSCFMKSLAVFSNVSQQLVKSHKPTSILGSFLNGKRG
jgi:hypothetical protein